MNWPGWGTSEPLDEGAVVPAENRLGKLIQPADEEQVVSGAPPLPPLVAASQASPERSAVTSAPQPSLPTPPPLLLHNSACPAPAQEPLDRWRRARRSRVQGWRGVLALGPEGTTTSVELSALALIARLATIVPPPRRHLTGYFEVLSLHSSLRSQCVPVSKPETTAKKKDEPTRAMPLSHYVSWSDLLRRTFKIDTVCARCKTPLRLISVIKTEETIKKILAAMGLPTEAPQPCPARPPPSEPDDPGGDFLN